VGVVTERIPTPDLIRSSAIRAATVLAVAFVAWILWHAPLALFVTAVSLLISVALDRAVSAMERRGVPRSAGIAIVLAALAAGLITLAVVFAIPAVNQLQQLVVSAPGLLERLRTSELYALVQRVIPETALKSAVPERAGDVVSSAMGLATGVVGGVAGVIAVFFITAFMLASGRPLLAAGLGAASASRRARSIHAALTTTFLGVLRIPWFLALGLMAGLSSLVPYIGVVIAGTVLVVVAGLSIGWWAAIATLAWVVTYQQVENHIVSPLVYRRALDVNPLVIIVSALILGEVWGIGGAVLSVPITAMGQIVVTEVMRFRRERGGDGSVALPDVKKLDRP
jgi:predicted PurR-regulated permease PerM